MSVRIVFWLSTIMTLVVGQGRIIIPDPMPEASPVVLKEVRTKVHIQNNIADVTLDQSFYNPNNRRLEGEYLYSFSGDTRVRDFSLYINGKKTKGRLLTAQKARKTYEAIVRAMRDPALLEFMDWGLFKARIFPMEPGQNRRIELRYEQSLSDDNNLYRFELPLRQSGQGTIDKMDITVHIDVTGQLGVIYSPSHPIQVQRVNARQAVIRFSAGQAPADKNLIIYYAESDADVDGHVLSFRPRTDQDGFFQLIFQPAFPSESDSRIPRDVVFVVDGSGSMGGEKIEQARQALKYCLQALHPEDRFQILRFSGDVIPFSDNLRHATQENIQNALYFVQRLQASGGTNLFEPLKSAFRQFKAPQHSRTQTVIMLTDGLPTEGVTDVRELVRRLEPERHAHVRLFSFGVGYDVNTWLLDRLARENQGKTRYVKPEESVEGPITRLFRKISTPVLTGVSLDYPAHKIHTLYPAVLPDLYKGQKLIISGRYRKGGIIKFTLTGNRNGEKLQKTYRIVLPKREEKHDFVARLWAGRRIDDLLGRLRFEGENKEWVDTIKKLGETYGIVTPYTAYLVTQDEQAMADMDEKMVQRLNTLSAQNAAGGSPSKIRAMLGSAAHRAQSGAVQNSVGMSAVLESEMMQKLIGGEERQEDILVTQRRVLGRLFIYIKGFWREKSDRPPLRIKKLRFGSEAYWTMVKRTPELNEVWALGDKLLFKCDGKWIQVTP